MKLYSMGPFISYSNFLPSFMEGNSQKQLMENIAGSSFLGYRGVFYDYSKW